jgi:threonine/homoserine/homoserine lactone efflux protein
LAFAQQAILLGFTAGTLPGATQTYIFNTTLTFGWRKSFIIIFSPLIIDPPLIVLVVFALRELPDWFLPVVRIGGGLLLFWIAYGAFQRLRAGGVSVENDNTETITRRGILGRALAMNIMSPGPYLYWGTITGPLLTDALEQSWWHAWIFLVGFYGTFLGVMAALVIVLNRMRALDERVVRWILRATILILLLLGTQLLLQGFGVVGVETGA